MVVVEFDWLNFTHGMPVVMTMTVVIPKDPAIVDRADQGIDVGQIVFGHIAIVRLPNFLSQAGTPSGPLQYDPVVYDLLSKRSVRRVLRHIQKRTTGGTWHDPSDLATTRVVLGPGGFLITSLPESTNQPDAKW